MKRILGICTVLVALIALTVPVLAQDADDNRRQGDRDDARRQDNRGYGHGQLAYRPRTSTGSTATIRVGRDIVAPTTGMKWQAWKSACET